MTGTVTLNIEDGELFPGSGKEPELPEAGQGALNEPKGTNPLIQAAASVTARGEAFKAKARDFYFQVLLSQYRCPECNG